MIKQNSYKLIVYHADVTALKDERLFLLAFSAASKQRKEKISKYHTEKDRRLSLGAELLLKKALSDQGVKTSDIHYDYGKYGKPVLAGLPDLRFNISHSGDHVMVSVSGSEVGCDIEKVREIDMSLAKRFFHPEEYAHICSTPPAERTELFFRYWTLKESYLKMTGCGLRIPLHSFRIDLSRPDNRTVLDTGEKKYYFHEPALCEGYRCGLCTEETILPEIHREEIIALTDRLMNG